MVYQASLTFLVFLLCGCASQQPRFKIYKIESNRQLLVRSLSDKDVLSYGEADGFLCVSPQDLERLAEEVIARENHCKEE